jgi:hypothetical protein
MTRFGHRHDRRSLATMVGTLWLDAILKGLFWTTLDTRTGSWSRDECDALRPDDSDPAMH